VRKAFDDDEIFISGKIDAPLLLLGLMYREASRAMEMEPGDNDSRFPIHLVNSRIGISQVEKLQNFINNVKPPSWYYPGTLIRFLGNIWPSNRSFQVSLIYFWSLFLFIILELILHDLVVMLRSPNVPLGKISLAPLGLFPKLEQLVTTLANLLLLGKSLKIATGGCIFIKGISRKIREPAAPLAKGLLSDFQHPAAPLAKGNR
jgi:hypothetical protein